MLHYSLTLPQGEITLVGAEAGIVRGVRGNMYRGSTTIAVWSPAHPIDLGGFKDGDELVVRATFNLNPTTMSADLRPPAINYVGLSVGACHSTDRAAVEGLEHKAKNLALGNVGHLLGGISTSQERSNDAIFYKAESYVIPEMQLDPPSRGKLINYVHKWKMIFNSHNTIDPSGKEVELVFGYGDPMFSEDIA